MTFADNRICEFCGQPFTAHNSRQIYCTEKKCRNKRIATYGYGGSVQYKKVVAEPSPLRKKPMLTLEEKSKLMKQSGISYPELQQIVEKAASKEEVVRQVERWKRKRFREESAKIADNVTVYKSTIGCTHGCSEKGEY